jgi:ABC-type nitrate/sulfonate/bicarbonate transport system substrate-binding protein
MKALIAFALALLLAVPAHAADKVRAGTAVPTVFTFTPLDVGIEMGIWRKHGIELEIFSMRGDAQLQQAMAAGNVEFGLGSGPGLAFVAKGAPVKGVAAFALQPANLTIIVAANSPVREVKDLKGKKISVTTAGSLTDWLARETSRQQGWGPDGITIVPLGAPTSSIAAMKNNQIDGIVIAAENAYTLEAKGEARLLLNLGNIAKDFHTHIIFARNDLLASNRDLVRRFVAAFFETVAFMRGNKAETVAIGARAMKMEPAIVARAYDEQMGMLSADGVFLPAAMEVLARSWVELDILPSKPDVSTLIDAAFVPPR